VPSGCRDVLTALLLRSEAPSGTEDLGARVELTLLDASKEATAKEEEEEEEEKEACR